MSLDAYTSRIFCCTNSSSLDLNAMPGCNPVQNGPNEATMINNCNAISTYIGQPAAPTQTSAPTVTVAPPVPTTTTVVNPQPTAPAGPPFRTTANVAALA